MKNVVASLSQILHTSPFGALDFNFLFNRNILGVAFLNISSLACFMISSKDSNPFFACSLSFFAGVLVNFFMVLARLDACPSVCRVVARALFIPSDSSLTWGISLDAAAVTPPSIAWSKPEGWERLFSITSKSDVFVSPSKCFLRSCSFNRFILFLAPISFRRICVIVRSRRGSNRFKASTSSPLSHKPNDSIFSTILRNCCILDRSFLNIYSGLPFQRSWSINKLGSVLVI
mmetsp:Transcript_3039/g.5687  ORF Transcript_3039/g.5687 Transcript_3039/m.5687 type:complete len:232 (-) Transcript_3039:3482-4177(-)